MPKGQKKLTLLEKAKATSVRAKSMSNQEEIELAMAWARDEIGIAQVQAALGTNSANAYTKLAIGMREWIRTRSKSKPA
jgi:hypothetical protein